MTKKLTERKREIIENDIKREEEYVSVSEKRRIENIDSKEALRQKLVQETADALRQKSQQNSSRRIFSFW